jgi:ParB family chromosome partitioning protein
MTTVEISTAGAATTRIPLAELHLADDNVRRELGDVSDLAASIKAIGLLEPLVVTPRAEGGYLVVAGARRLAACAKLGWGGIDAIAREFSEQERVLAMAIENLQREDLSVLEEAEAYRRLTQELGLSQRELAKRVGRSQPHISKRLALLELPEAVQQAVDSGGITLEDAQQFGKLTGSPKHLTFALQKIKEGWGARPAVGRALEELELDERVAKATARLKKQGARVLSFVKEPAYGYLLPKGATKITKSGGWDALKLDPAEHAGESCHAAAVNPRSGEIVYLCTDRKRHPKAKTDSERGRRGSDPAQAKRREHDNALAAARDARRGFVGDLLGRKLPKDEVVGWIVRGLMGRAEAEAKKVACRMLGLPPAESDNGYGGTHKKFEQPLEQLAATGPAGELKVGLALALATEEIRMGSYWSAWHDDQERYLGFLGQHGYEITNAEQLELSGKAPKKTGY